MRQAADTWEDNDLVFCSRDGRLLWPRSVSGEWYALRAAAKLPETTKLHHLCHALATMLDESGATEALKAGILGHEPKGVTQRYTHARIAAMREVLETVISKVMLLVNAALVVLYLSGTQEGRRADKQIADFANYQLPQGSQLLQDLGFLAFSLTGVIGSLRFRRLTPCW